MSCNIRCYYIGQVFLVECVSQRNWSWNGEMGMMSIRTVSMIQNCSVDLVCQLPLIWVLKRRQRNRWFPRSSEIEGAFLTVFDYTLTFRNEPQRTFLWFANWTTSETDRWTKQRFNTWESYGIALYTMLYNRLLVSSLYLLAVSAPCFGSRGRGFESRWRRDSSRT